MSASLHPGDEAIVTLYTAESLTSASVPWPAPASLELRRGPDGWVAEVATGDVDRAVAYLRNLADELARQRHLAPPTFEAAAVVHHIEDDTVYVLLVGDVPRGYAVGVLLPLRADRVRPVVSASDIQQYTARRPHQWPE